MEFFGFISFRLLILIPYGFFQSFRFNLFPLDLRHMQSNHRSDSFTIPSRRSLSMDCFPFGFLDPALFGCCLFFFRSYPFKPRFFRNFTLHLRGFRRLLRLVGPTVVVSRDAESSCFHESLQLSVVHPCISVAGNGSFPEVCAVHPLIPQLVSSCFHDLVCCGEATALFSGSVPYIPLSLERATARRLMR